MNRKALAVVTLLLPLSAGGADVASHCTPDEQIVFSCSVGKKTVSLCASKDLAQKQGYVQYRFGPLGALELVHPGAKAHPVSHFKGEHTLYGSGYITYVAFAPGAYRYIVYDAYFGSGVGEHSGVEVEKAGKRVAKLACRSQQVDNLDADFIRRTGLQPDAAGFVLNLP